MCNEVCTLSVRERVVPFDYAQGHVFPWEKALTLASLVAPLSVLR
jgi:hypothetical protein